MKGELMAVALSPKTASVAASSPILAWFASMWGWIDVHMVRMSATASFVLVLVMIVAHICSTIRQNREHKVKILLMQKELERASKDEAN